MKRYRVIQMDYDTSPTILSMEISPDWELSVRENWEGIKASIANQLLQQFGADNIDKKLDRFKTLGSSPFSILAFHNEFFAQARAAFVIGGYYPALAGACALGERILNHLMLNLREDFRSTPEYRRVHTKDSFDNWDLAINTLDAWGVLLPEVVIAYRRLKGIRNRTIHFNPITDTNDRQFAEEALRILTEIISKQFGAFGTQPWFIQTAKGEAFIKSEWETRPFIRRVYLPNTVLVSPRHRMEHGNEGWRAVDLEPGEGPPITDDEFVEQRDAFLSGSARSG